MRNPIACCFSLQIAFQTLRLWQEGLEYLIMSSLLVPPTPTPGYISLGIAGKSFLPGFLADWLAAFGKLAVT